MASIPVKAVRCGGSPTVNSASSTARSGISGGPPTTTLRLRDGTVITVLRPTSLPVPAVVGIAQNGTSRAGHFFVSDADFFGSAFTWLENGNVGYWGGGGFFINDTGVPIIYDQWVSFELVLDYVADSVTVFYDGNQVATDTLTGTGAGFASQLDVWLDTVPLADNPNPGDWVAFDDIHITPEPTSLGLLLIGGDDFWTGNSLGFTFRLGSRQFQVQQGAKG